MQGRQGSSLKSILLSATLLASVGAAHAGQPGHVLPNSVTPIDDGVADNTGLAPLPTGQLITPNAAPGSSFTLLSPSQPEYTSAVGNYPYFKPDGAIASTLSPDGKTLAVMTSGYNVLDDINANLVGNGAEFIVLYDVSASRTPVMIQTLRPLNTFVGLAFSPNGATLYVSGGADDDVIVYTKVNGQFSQTGTIDLGHGGYPGLPPNGLPGGIGVGQYPQAGGLAVSKDGSLLAIANSLNNSVTLIRTSDNTKLFEYDLRPYNTSGANGVAGGETLYSVALKGNRTLYATSVRDREVVVVDISTGMPKFVTRISLPGSPNNLLLNRAQTKLYVAQDNSDTVAVIDTRNNAVIEEIDAIAPPGTFGNSNNRYTGAVTNNIALGPDDQRLFITNGGANDVAIAPLTGPAPHAVAALVPTGWYPTTLTVSRDGRMMYVFNSKSDPGANPAKKTSSLPHLKYYTYPGGNTFANEYNADEYVFQLERSGVLVAPIPTPAEYAGLTAQVVANNGWGSTDNPADDATVSFLQQHIQHIIYIVKENRTFDQVLGDLTNGANGDPGLTIFGEKITPNFHALSQQFVTLDNTFDTGEVSGNGWPWSTEARETDWNEKNIPMSYTFGVDRGDAPYVAEGQDNNVSVAYAGATPAATVAARQAEAGGFDYTANANQYPGGALNMLPGQADDGAPDGPNDSQQQGHIWDAALKAGLTVRNYGFFSDNSHYGLQPTDPGYSAPIEFPYLAAQSGTPGARQEWTAAAALIPYTDEYFRGFDNVYPDFWRFEEFQREFRGFEQQHNLPNLITLRYMHDHMGSFSTALAGLNFAEAQQADNDYAVGRTVEMLANSPEYAGNTLVIVTEDDAQDGGDHMDAHRETAYIAGPYVRQGAVISTRYSSVNLLRTIEDVLGLQHLNLNTAYQRPMTDVFDITLPGTWSYKAIASTVLKQTSLDIAMGEMKGVQFASGADVLPKNTAAWWAAHTKNFDFSSEDRVPAEAFNKVIWEGMMGDAPYPSMRSGIVTRNTTLATPVSLRR